MDQATQQNAALVEEMSAAASSLRSQAQELVQAVAVFKVGQTANFSAAPKASSMNFASTPPAASKPVAKSFKSMDKPALKPAPKASKADDADWESF
jgi:hypothetical protein